MSDDEEVLRARWFLFFAGLAACAVPPARPTGAVVTIPAGPPPSAAPAASASAPRAVDAEIKDVVLPDVPCVIAAKPPAKGSPLSMEHIHVGGVSVASVRALGTIRHVRLALAEGRPKVAALEIDAETLSVKGAAPLQSDSTDNVALYGKTRVMRDGWLEYEELRVASVSGARLEPKTELPAFVTPAPGFADAPFMVACADLTPFVAGREEAPNAKLLGTKVTLEDEGGRKVATVDAGVDGIPVQILGTRGKKRTKVRIALDERLAAEVWVASGSVKEAAWGGLIGYGSGSGRLRAKQAITCPTDVPVRVTVKGTTFAWATLHAKQRVEGERLEDGSFALTVLGGGSNGAIPFVPSDKTEPCAIEGFRPPMP